jgi:membrane protein DedA with SNARE-associated domain
MHLHLNLHLSRITEFIGSHPQYAVWAVFLLAFSEAIPIVGTIVPGSTLIIAISALAVTTDLNPWLLLVAAVVGAILGDGASFWLGQLCHEDVLTRWPLKYFPGFIAKSEEFFRRFGGASVFLARFTAVVRAFVPLIAGILRMPARQFYIANVLSAVVWAPAHVFPGVVLGLLARVEGAGTRGILVLAVVVTLLGVGIVRAVRYGFDRGYFGGSSLPK